MRLGYAVAAVLLLAAGGSATARSNGEAELAKALRGRVPGKPVSCIFLPQVRDTRIIDRTAILYDAGGTIYVNRPTAGARQLTEWDVMVTKPTGSQLCDVDIVRLYERGSRIERGFVDLGKFVPYVRARR